MEIELKKEYRGGVKSTTFSGRAEGEEVRSKLDLDTIDRQPDHVVVKLPDDTTSFNPSFFLGLFFKSIKYLKSVEAFKQKYSFDLSNFDTELKGYIKEDITDCYIRCDNELKRKTAIDL